MAAKRRKRSPRTRRVRPTMDAHRLSVLSERMDDFAKELAWLLRRIGELQAQIDRMSSDEEQTG